MNNIERANEGDWLQQCYDCGFGHECVVGNVYAHMGLVDAAYAQSHRPEEYDIKAHKEVRAIGKMLGSILSARR